MTAMFRHAIVAILCLHAFEVIVLEAAKQNVQLSDSYLPVAMQVIAHLTDQMAFLMHEESEAKPPKPTTKPPTTPKPLYVTSDYFQTLKPKSWWWMPNGILRDETTPFHQPGYYAPASPPKPSERISQKQLQQNDSSQNKQNYVSPQNNQQNLTPQNQQYLTPQNQQQYPTSQNEQQYPKPQNQQQYLTPQNHQQNPMSQNEQKYPTPQSQQQYPTPQSQEQYPAPQNQQQYPTPQYQQQYSTSQNQQQYPTPQYEQQYQTPHNQHQYAISQVQQQYSYPSQQQPYNYPTQDQQQYYFPSQNQPQYNFPSQYPEQYNILPQNQQTNFQENQNQNEFSQNQQVFNVSLQEQYLNNDYQPQYNIFQNQQAYNTPQNQQFNVMTFDLPQYNPLQPQSGWNEEPLLSAHHEEVKPLMEPTPNAPQLLPPHFETDVDKISSRSKGFDVDELTEENLQYLSHNVREMIRMAHDPHDERLVDVWEGLRARPLEPAPKGKMSSSNLRLLLLYDLLSREAKRQRLSDYSGFSPDVMNTLVESSSGGAREQLKMALSKMVERKDCAHEYANNRAKEMVTELGKDDSKFSSEIRYLQPLVYKY